MPHFRILPAAVLLLLTGLPRVEAIVAVKPLPQDSKQCRMVRRNRHRPKVCEAREVQRPGRLPAQPRQQIPADSKPNPGKPAHFSSR
jgi:hypothetical protein